MNNKIIAIDFDGTITTFSPYPITGKVREYAKLYIRKLYEAGYCLVLWTCREGQYLDEAINILIDNDLYKYFSYINDSPISYGRKIYADFYVDDKSILGDINWFNIYTYIVSNIK